MIHRKLTLAVLLALGISQAQAADDTIKIGVQAPITGEYASEGQAIDKGVKLVAEQTNAKGGVLGKKIEVITCDDEGTALKSAICAKELVSKGVMAVIGSYTSTAAEAALPTYLQAGVLQTTDGTSDSLTKKGAWTFFRNAYPNIAEATLVADYFVKQKKYKNIVVLSDFSSYATGLADAVESEIKKAGGKVIMRDKVKANSQNFTPILTNIKAKNPDVIFYAGYYTDGGLIRAQQQALGIKADFVAGDANDNTDFVKLAGKAAEGAYIVNTPTPDILPYPIAKEFLSSYKAKYNESPPSIYAFTNTDGMRAILHAIEQTKSTDTKVVADYLHKLKDFPGTTGPVSFGKDGERLGSGYMVYRIKADGKYEIAYRQDGK